MNRFKAKLKTMDTLDKIDRQSTYATREGCSKYWLGVSYKHYMVMCQILWKLKNQGYKVYTEVKFKNNKLGRADILAIDTNGNPTIVEILHTESEKKLQAKRTKYPFPLRAIKTENFNLEEFEL